MDKDGFDLETRTLSGSGELGASARNRASSLSDKPTGTDPSGGKSGDTVCNQEDRRWSASISARNRASSLSEKPTGTDPSGGKSGETAGR